MDATMRLAQDYWNEKFREADRAEEDAKQAALAVRKSVETLYIVSPYGAPELANSSYFREARNAEEMAWAEERLTSLGFKVKVEDRVKSYLDERPDFVVYADPRNKGEISFTAYKLPIKRKGRGPNWDAARSFRLLDAWKNGLPEKYEKRVREAVAGFAANN